MKKNNPWIRKKKNVKFASKKRQFRILFKFVITLVLLVGVTYGGHRLFKHLEIFSLKKIEIQGDPKALSREKIIALSQVKLGTNLFELKIQNIKEHLKDHPYFKSVSVQRRFPHTLIFHLQEYLPEFVLNAGHLYYVDAEGHIFKDITNTKDDRDFVVLSGFDSDEVKEKSEQLMESVKSAAELKKTFQQFPFSTPLGLSEIHFEKNIGFTLYTEKKKYSIKVGLKEFSEKFNKLAEIWPKFEKMDGGVSLIDLNYPGKILMKM